VEGTVIHGCFQPQQRISSNDAVLHLLFDAFLNRRYILFWNHTADDFINKLELIRAFIFSWLKTNPHMAILTATARLPNKLSFDFRFVSNPLTVRHLGLTNISLDTELTTHAIHNDIQVQLTHT